jgi:hypothetical protein
VLSQDLSGAWVTIQGESQLGQVPLHRIRKGLKTPWIKFGLGCFMRLSSEILAENPDGSMLVHMKGHEGNHPTGTQI